MTTDIEWTPKARAILAAADELFYARGIHAVGVDAVAARAGVTKKTLYDRFGSKDRLVVAYLAEREAQWRAVLDRRLAEAGTDPATRLRAAFDAVAAWTGERGGKGCAMVNAHAEISDPGHPAFPLIVGSKRHMRAVFAGIAQDAGAADPDALADTVLFLYDGALVAAGMDLAPAPFARARDVALGLLAAA